MINVNDLMSNLSAPFKLNPVLATDGYKTSHQPMYPAGTNLVFSNLTPRNVKYMPKQAKKIVVFGSQYTMIYIHQFFKHNFFDLPKEKAIGEAKAHLSSYLNVDYDMTIFEELHDLGYLPIHVRVLPEGLVIKEKVPILVIYNTIDKFFWITNFLETLISSLIWKPMHSASLAYGFKEILLNYAKKTDEKNIGFVDFQGHDFSFRGMQHVESAITSGLGFLTSFSGTDTIPTLQAAEHYYFSENVGFGVPASEHSVMTAYGQENEIDAFKRIMDMFPNGIVSVVSDQFDLWKVITEYIPQMKEQIMNRDGKLVIRPDSGDPVDIICGKIVASSDYRDVVENEHLDTTLPEYKGAIELLWEAMGGTINDQGFKVLDSHIGLIYGDSITLERAEEICKRLEKKGFASTNVVLGVGSYSLGYATRDQQGCAIKATYVEVNGVGREIFKDPITDDGTKKSARGLVMVYKDENNEYQLKDRCSWDEVNSDTNEMKSLYIDGEFKFLDTLENIRQRIN
jgi:nicotinamide phosphoribosyltransferase